MAVWHMQKDPYKFGFGGYSSRAQAISPTKSEILTRIKAKDNVGSGGYQKCGYIYCTEGGG
jgi:hypothetical protein